MNLSLPDAGVRRGTDDLAAMAARVTALYEHPAYRRLAGDARRLPCALAGASRAEADTAVARVRALLADYEALEEAAGAEIPWDVAAIGARHDAMNTAAAAARVSLDAFEVAWEELPASLGMCESRLAALECPSGTKPLRERLDALRTAVDLDPLGVIAALHGEFIPALQSLENARATVLVELEQAAARAAVVTERHAAAAVLIAKRDARILKPGAAALPAAETLHGLRGWLDKLGRSAASGRWLAVSRALTVWTRRAEEIERGIHAAHAEAEAALAERRRLRGWMHALCAKAGAVGRAECPRFTAAALEAGRLLHSRPTPMPRVRALLADCQALLSHER